MKISKPLNFVIMTLLLHWRVLKFFHGNDKRVIFEITFSDRAIWHDHPSVPVLCPSVPLALVAAAILPVHFSVSVALVLLKLAVVLVAGSPDKFSDAVALIILEITFIAVHIRDSLGASPLPLSLSFSTHHLPLVVASIAV